MDRVSGEPVLLYPEGLLQLNPTAHAIISHCNGLTTVREILDSLGSEFDIDSETLCADVFACLAELEQKRLLVFTA